MTENEEHEKKQEYMNRMTVQMSEHFDSIQIIASSVCQDGATKLWWQGSGNYYARQGMVKEWLDIDNASTVGRYVAKEIKKDE